MKRRFPTIVYVIAFILGLEFIAQGLLPVFHLVLRTPARMVLSVQYFTTGLLIIIITYCLFKEGGRK